MNEARIRNPECRVAMAGRSVMGHWFKFWNYPDILSRHAIYFPWPVPYKQYARDGYRFEYIRVSPPHAGGGRSPYGQEMLASLRRQVGGKQYDVLFFKLCFVDFRDKHLKDEGGKEKLFEGMKSLVEQVHAFARQEKATLILGNALPVLNAGDTAQRLRREYNEWIGGYAGRNPDTSVFDFFGLLSDEQGKLVPELARNAFDPHLNKNAYTILEKELLSRLAGVGPPGGNGRPAPTVSGR